MLRCLQLVLPWRRGQEKPYTRYLRRQRPSQLRLLIRAKTSQVFRRRPNMLSGNLLGHANDKTRRQHYVLPFSPSNGTRRSSNAVGVAGTTHRDHPNGVGGHLLYRQYGNQGPVSWITHSKEKTSFCFHIPVRWYLLRQRGAYYKGHCLPFGQQGRNNFESARDGHPETRDY